MLEEVFVPMAKSAMEIIAGKPGEPGMAEDLRKVRAQLESLLTAYSKDSEQTKEVRKDQFRRLENLEDWKREEEEQGKAKQEITLMGIKVSSEVKIAVINGAFLLAALLVGWFLK